MDQNNYRPLLPASGLARQASHEADKTKLKRKRGQVANVACNTCRAKKLACDARRPACTRCQEKGLRCVYQSIDESETPSGILKREIDTLRQRFNAMEELIDHLRYMPKEIAQLILERLRVALDPALVLRSIRGDVLGHRLSELTPAGGILPSIQLDFEFELTTQHPVAYPTLGPAQESVFLRSRLLRRNKKPGSGRPQSSHSVHSIVVSLEISSQGSESPKATSARDGKMQGLESAAEPEALSTDGIDPRIGPEAPARYIDQRLERLAIASWTTVQVTNEYAAGAISLYLETDHPVLGLFDEDAFIDSLVDCKSDFCSSFLVNSILAFSCQAYTSRDPEAAALSYDLEREAENIWQTERPLDSLPTLAALSLMWLSLLSHGQGEGGRKYIEAVWQVAMRMKLFGVPETLGAAELQSLSRPKQRATAYAAWGAFNMVIMQSLYAFPACTDYPPTIPIPGHDGNVRAPHGETETIELPAPAEKGQTFTSFCGFWTIVSETLYVYHQPDGRRRPSLDFAQSKYNKLLAWADALGHPMIRAEESSGHVLVFHLWYHAIVLEIFRPFIANERHHDLASGPASATPPDSIFGASLNQLKRLVLLYRNHEASRHSILWQPALLSVANAALRDTRDPEWRFYFLLCVHSYQRLLPCFRLAEAVVQGLLAIALSAGALSSAEAQLINSELREKGRRARRRTERQRGAGFVLDLDLALTDWDAAQVDRLRDKFEDIVLFNDFTDGIV